LSILKNTGNGVKQTEGDPVREKFETLQAVEITSFFIQRAVTVQKDGECCHTVSLYFSPFSTTGDSLLQTGSKYNAPEEEKQSMPEGFFNTVSKPDIKLLLYNRHLIMINNDKLCNH